MTSLVKNIAIIAHVDAGKTTLSERMLYLSKAIHVMGEVDDGLSTMDFLPEEQKRGITIEAGIATFDWKQSRITLLDTPGHVDFSAEVDSALTAVESAIVVVSARNGLETQTRLSWKKLCKYDIQPIFFINKLDTPGIGYRAVLQQIESDFGVRCLPMTLPVFRNQSLIGVIDVLNQKAVYCMPGEPRDFVLGTLPNAMVSESQMALQVLSDAATKYNSNLTEKVLSEQTLTPKELIEGIKQTLKTETLVPVYCGSALTNIGVRQLLNGLHFFSPSPKSDADPTQNWATVLKSVDFPEEGTCPIVRLHPSLNQPVQLPNRVKEFLRIQARVSKPTRIASPGEIIGLKMAKDSHTAKPGDVIYPDGGIVSGTHSIVQTEPLLKTRFEAIRTMDFEKIDQTLRALVQKECSVQLQNDTETGAWVLTTMGEVQLEVLHERLVRQSGCEVMKSEPEVRYQERLEMSLAGRSMKVSTGEEWLEVHLDIQNDSSAVPFKYRNLSNHNSARTNRVIESVIFQFCEKGVCGFGSLRNINLTIRSIEFSAKTQFIPLLHKALSDCLKFEVSRKMIGIYEPIMHLQIRVPHDYCGLVISDLNARAGKILSMESTQKNHQILCEIPLKRIFGYATLLRSLSKGQGNYQSIFDRFELLG